jgi:hypothetical protein
MSQAASRDALQSRGSNYTPQSARRSFGAGLARRLALRWVARARYSDRTGLIRRHHPRIALKDSMPRSRHRLRRRPSAGSMCHHPQYTACRRGSRHHLGSRRARSGSKHRLDRTPRPPSNRHSCPRTAAPADSTSRYPVRRLSRSRRRNRPCRRIRRRRPGHRSPGKPCCGISDGTCGPSVSGDGGDYWSYDVDGGRHHR